MRHIFWMMLRADGGGSAAEYGFVAGLVGIVIIVSVAFAGDAMGNFFNNIGRELSNALPQLSKLH